jgi:hypothetical protein
MPPRNLAVELVARRRRGRHRALARLVARLGPRLAQKACEFSSV